MAQQPGTNKYIDLVKNAEPVAATQIPALVSAVVLYQLDKVLHFTTPDPNDPFASMFAGLLAYLIVNVVALAWARMQVWSKNSHVAEVSAAATAAYDQGKSEGTTE